MERYDIVFVGGGLANTLAALRLAISRPEASLCIVERGPRLGGNHTWSFHDTDLDGAELEWTEPLVAHRWPNQEVRFPGHERVLGIGYRSVTSERLHHVASEVATIHRIHNADVTAVAADGVGLADGRRIAAGAVVDGRGAVAADALALAWQKFVGHEILTDAPHGVERPVIMDATVEQLDGYRFLYFLPFAPNRLLIEDTYYSDAPGLDAAEVGLRIADYADHRGWRIVRTVREETGVLPIALAGDIDAMWLDGVAGVARTGLSAGLFHPTTGYSLPDAVRLADAIAALPDLTPRALVGLTHRHSRSAWRRRGFFRFLNRMMFIAAEPAERYRLLERFYRLPEPLIGRFYADRMTLGDRARLLSGRPPIPVGRALACLTDASGRRSAGMSGAPPTEAKP